MSEIRPIINYRCPTCGYAGNEALQIFDEAYCLLCFSKWVGKHIPKLKEGYVDAKDN